MKIIEKRIKESIELKQIILGDLELLQCIEKSAALMAEKISQGGKIITCGNGGSASDAIHLTGEIVGRFQKEREPWPAVALPADIAALTAISNDYGFENVFAREVKAFLNEKDVLVAISTSGNSENIFRAVLEAKQNGVPTVALLGGNGGKIQREVDYPLIIPCKITARVQECHIMIIHIICELIENTLAEHSR